MNVLFSNPPWWVGREDLPRRGLLRRKETLWRSGVRAGSRWPFTQIVQSSPDECRFGDYLPYPFFMGYAATYAARALGTGAKVHFRDSIALRESYESFYAHLEAERYDYLFIESATPSWEHDKQILLEIHRRNPRIRFVVAGPITSTKSEEILRELPVHACIRGEYEKGSVRVLEGKSGVLEHDLLTVEEMNASPFPYYDTNHATNYWDGNPLGQVAPHAQIWSSRGCPFKCIFCVWPATMTGNDPDGEQKRSVRQYTADYMSAFVTELIDRYHFKSIYFDDDTFNLGRRHVENMCGVMSGFDIPWTAMCRADTIKMETWKVMADAGCVGVKLGFESGNQFVVDQIVNKHLDLEYGREVVHYLKDLGMSVHGTFTYGLPGETHEQMLDTKRFIASLPFDTVQESGTAEIEGTPLHTLRQSGKLEAYAGARIDAGYQRATDGNRKFQSLVDQLQDH